MYWYPFNDDEETRAWGQAEAQTDGSDSDGSKKFIGNLGELAVMQYLSEYSDSDCWHYHNKEAMDNQQTEYSTVDFTIGRSGMDADVKATTDIRKFDPVSMYYDEQDKHGVARDRNGYPRVDTGSADIFIFVLISKHRDTTPNSKIIDPDSINDDEWEEMPKSRKRYVKERSGNHVASILGWLSATEFEGEMTSNMNRGAKGKFTRMAIRDMHELLLRTDAQPDT